MKLLPLLALILLTASANAMTKSECIHAGYGCQWSRASGGRVNGWFYAKERETKHEDVHRHANARLRLAEGQPAEPEHEAHRRTVSALPRRSDALVNAMGAADGGSRQRERGISGAQVEAKSDEGSRAEPERFHIEDWLAVFSQRERTVLTERLLVKAQALRGK